MVVLLVGGVKTDVVHRLLSSKTSLFHLASIQCLITTVAVAAAAAVSFHLYTETLIMTTDRQRLTT